MNSLFAPLRKRLARFALQYTIVTLIATGQWSCSRTANTANVAIDQDIDTAQISDTTRDINGLPAAGSIFEWKVEARNIGYIFNDFRQLKDGSFVATLTSHHAISYAQPIGFFDSKDRKILEGHEENVQLLLKVKKDGEKAWVKMYSDTEEDFIQLKSFTVNDEGRIITLVQLGYEYFAKLEKENREEEESNEEQSDDEREQIDTSRNTPPEDFNASFGLQFLRETNNDEPAGDAIVLIPDLAADVGIVAFEAMGKDRFVIVGRTYDQDISHLNEREPGDESGDFIWVIDSKGNRVWSDVTRFSSREGFYYNNEYFKPSVSIHDDVIYVGSQHFGEVTFSNGETLKSNISPAEGNRWTYVISYSREGNINWVRGNETLSNVTSIKAGKNGVYLSQKIYGNNVFGNRVDTSGHINQFVTLLDRHGKHQWSSGFPVNNIWSIQVDTKGLPVIMGNYNDVIYDMPLRNLKYHGLNLNNKHDLFVISLDRAGSASTIFSVDLNLENSLNSNRPQMIVGKDDSIYIICHSDNFFEDSFDYKAYERTQHAGQISFLGKLRHPR